jgi:hypothetical protein
VRTVPLSENELMHNEFTPAVELDTAAPVRGNKRLSTLLSGALITQDTHVFLQVGGTRPHKGEK